MESTLNIESQTEESILSVNEIHHGRSEELMLSIPHESIALSFWSPPYFVGKEYERGATYGSWQAMLERVIQLHYDALRPGGFLVINIADIMAFADPVIPRYQALNKQQQRIAVTKDRILQAKEENPGINRDQLAQLLGL